MDPESSTSKLAVSKLTISCDRQARPSLVAFNKAIKYSAKKSTIISKIPPGTMNECITTLCDLSKVKPGSFYITYNGQSWARSKYLHFKMFIKPDIYMTNKLYPQWTRLSNTVLLSNFKRRWDKKLFEYLQSLVLEITTADRFMVIDVYKLDGYLHGIYSNNIYTCKDLDKGLLNLENYLFSRGFKGDYSIFIYPYTSEGGVYFFISARVDEKLFKVKYPIVEMVESEYKEPKRFYYIRERNIPDSNYNFPTSKTLIRKKRR